MKNMEALELANSLIWSYWSFSCARYKKLGERKYDSIYKSWDVQSFYNLRNLFFNLVTKESNFDEFYSRFDAPGSTKGLKPIAWGPRFLPDMIDTEIWNNEITLEQKIKRIEKLYQKCIKLEKEFKPKASKS